MVVTLGHRSTRPRTCCSHQTRNWCHPRKPMTFDATSLASPVPGQARVTKERSSPSPKSIKDRPGIYGYASLLPEKETASEPTRLAFGSSEVTRGIAGREKKAALLMPGAPLLAFTRFHALRIFARSTIRSIRSSCKAGCVNTRRASAPPVGLVAEGECITAPPCTFVFGPSPWAPSWISRLVWPLLTSARSRPALPQDALSRTSGRVRWLPHAFRHGPQSGSRGLSRLHARQISPNKNMNCQCTTAAFTLSPVAGGLRHLVLTRPETEPSMRFLSVGSHLCARASFRPPLAGLPLPSASSYKSGAILTNVGGMAA